jgi:DNA polymerase I-like protein with 3'-5' exonuclease and polymerase domains
LEETKGRGIAFVLSDETDSLFGGTGITEIECAADEDTQVTVEWNADTKEVFREFFGHPKRSKIVFDTKATMHRLIREGISLSGVARDVSLMDYLLDAGSRQSFSDIVSRELGTEDTQARAAALYRVNAVLGQKLKDISATQESGRTLLDVYATLDLPLVPILFRMEEKGVRLNTETLQSMSDEGLEKSLFSKNAFGIWLEKSSISIRPSSWLIFSSSISGFRRRISRRIRPASQPPRPSSRNCGPSIRS